MLAPWYADGYDIVLVDPQHPEGVHTENGITRIGHIIDHPATWRYLSSIRDAVFVCGFPPCTDVAVSGSRHFERKFAEDPHYQTRAALVAEQCRIVGLMLNVPYMFENPVSVFSSIFGKPDYIFNPFEYGGYLPARDKHPMYPEFIAPRDAYPKKTCLWVGNGFIMPEKKPVKYDKGYSKQYAKLGGKSQKTKNIRSATPRGFAMAVFQANRTKGIGKKPRGLFGFRQTQLVNMRVTKNFDVRIDRQSVWGNKNYTKNESVAERDRVCDCHHNDLWSDIYSGKITLSDLDKLYGLKLGCWCTPLRCHGDDLVIAVEWAHEILQIRDVIKKRLAYAKFRKRAKRKSIRKR